jgi:hypothetical protein
VVHGSFSRRQYHITVDPKTGKELRLANGDGVPKRTFRVVASKYTKEERGCYCACSALSLMAKSETNSLKHLTSIQR